MKKKKTYNEIKEKNKDKQNKENIEKQAKLSYIIK
jgi:hypothetical protein